MDCDGTHHPKYINQMFKKLKNSEIVLTNRFQNKNSIKGWEIKRLLITKIRFYLVRALLGSKLDSSGGYRLYDFNSVRLKDIFEAKDNGYSFFIESTFILERKKYKIAEIPIILPKRVIGSSKMRLKDIVTGIFGLLSYFLKRIFAKY
tara:strand:+ start:18 stop:461 length:444 start_codon:yes stop_codon:yes gene_type:complete